MIDHVVARVVSIDVAGDVERLGGPSPIRSERCQPFPRSADHRARRLTQREAGGRSSQYIDNQVIGHARARRGAAAEPVPQQRIGIVSAADRASQYRRSIKHRRRNQRRRT